MSTDNSRLQRSHNNSSGGFPSAYVNHNDHVDDTTKRKPMLSARGMTASLLEFEDQISKEISQNRRQEVYEYLKLFGYQSERTIIQLYITGYFKKKTYSQREKNQHNAAVKRYGGTTFVIVGRTHDPSIMNNLIKPKKKNPYETIPGYIGYLWKNKDPLRRPPHEVIPMDFTPIHLPYPIDWKNRFATKGFMVALHVPSYAAKSKNRLTRALYRIAKTKIDIKQEWKFLDELKNLALTEEAHDTKSYDSLNDTIRRSKVKNTQSAEG